MAEFERMRLHPYLTERILHRVPGLQRGGIGRGQSSRMPERLRVSARAVCAAADDAGPAGGVLRSATSRRSEPRPYREAMSPASAARRLRARVRDGELDAVGGRCGAARGGSRVANPKPRPDGLTAREVEVLRLVAQGASNKEIADETGDQREDRAQPRRAHVHQDRRLKSYRCEHVRARARPGGPVRKLRHWPHALAGSSTDDQSMTRFLTFSYGAVSYLLFLVVFVYSILFVGDVVVPRTVDHAISASVGRALAIDAVLLTVFAAQHSVMARPAFKRWWMRYVAQPIERSTYVLLASLVLALVIWQWRSIPAVVWDVTWAPARLAIWVLFWLGWAIVLASTFMINHLELFGLRQVFAVWRSRPQAETGFRTTLFYRVVRHPLNLGFIVAFWSAPTMTAGHLLFAVATTGWILIAMQLEERDLAASLGPTYAAYRESVPMLIPGLRKLRSASLSAPKSRDLACPRSRP